MKIFCMHLKIFFFIFAFAILLGIITVTPCSSDEKCSLCGRKFGFDPARVKELSSSAKNKISSLCSRK